jgi:hypothetical protein
MERQELLREWQATLDKHGLKLEDAKEKLNLVVDKQAQKGAKEGEPGFCTFARAAKAAGALEVMFGNKIANIVLRDKKRKLHAYRYTLPRVIEVMILAKDTGGEVKEGIYTLNAPTKARTLAKAKERSKVAAKKWKETPKAVKQAIAKRQADRKAERVQEEEIVAKEYVKRNERRKTVKARKQEAVGRKPVKKASIRVVVPPVAPKRVTLQLRDFSGNNGYQQA